MSEFNSELRNIMLATAAASIRFGLQHQQLMSVSPEDYPHALQQQRACFVTLHHQSQLRGCIGNLLAIQPLIIDVVHNAYAAAFSDPRFTPLNPQEYPDLDLHISILSVPEAMEINNEKDLLKNLRQGIDGLILEEGLHRATFLPSVWEQLPETKEFVNQLKRKAGLSPQYWSEHMKVSRYSTESFSAPMRELHQGSPDRL